MSAAHEKEFGGKIYGIEPGSNEYLIDMVKADRYDLGDWEVVESSEQAMLSAVSRAEKRNDWIVFLAWQPHPMNRNYDFTYLSGGDETMGPDFGGSTVRTIARAGFSKDCPNAAALLTNLVFDVEYENAGMGLILDDGIEPQEAAREMMRNNPDRVAKWLDGVTTRDGKDALPVVQAYLDEKN